MERRPGQRLKPGEAGALGWTSGAPVDPQTQMQLPGMETHDEFRYLPRWEDLPAQGSGNVKGQREVSESLEQDFGVTYRGMRRSAGAILDRAKQRAMDSARSSGATGLEALEAQPQGRDFYGVSERERIAERARGFGIYDGPNDPARPHLDPPKGEGTDYDTAASMVAAISPKTAWAETPQSGPDAGKMRYPNLDAAEEVAYQESSGGGGRLTSRTTALLPNLVKAARIYDGEPAEQVLGGKKVESFDQNLRHPWRDDARTTVDTHMVDALSGLEKRSGEQFLGRKGAYEMTDRAIRDAAAERGIKPEEAQSIMWHQQKAESQQATQGWRHQHTRDERVVGPGTDQLRLELDPE